MTDQRRTTRWLLPGVQCDQIYLNFDTLAILAFGIFSESLCSDVQNFEPIMSVFRAIWQFFSV